jgi:hypothetical protein
MPDDLPPLPQHGAAELRGIRIDSCSLDLPAGVGPQAHRAFDAVLGDWRRRLARAGGADPFGGDPTAEVPEDLLDAALAGSAPDAAGLVQGVVEDFARGLTTVIRRILSLPDWSGTQRVVVGGGSRSPRVCEAALGRAGVLLRADGSRVSLAALRHDREEAGLVGAMRLLPHRQVAAADAVLAADLSGGAFRAGVVLPRLGVSPGLAAAGLWRTRRLGLGRARLHRDRAVERLAAMLAEVAGDAMAAGLSLAPAIAVAVPARVAPDGRLSSVARSLPGDWEEEEFRLPEALAAALRREGLVDHSVLLHNDAVCQGLSDAPFQRDVARWGLVTPAAELGNARFTNLPSRR